MKNKAFTMAETLIAIVMLGVLGACALSLIKPSNIKKDALTKAGSSVYLQIGFATKQILAKNSLNYQMTKLLTLSGVQFSINDEEADEKLAELYKKALYTSRNSTVPATYTALSLKNEEGSVVGSSLTVSNFTQGFKTKNGAYMALMLHDNCTTNETYIYDPSAPELRTAKKSCGLIFFDVNADKAPNIVGIDQYIISIGKLGIK